MKTVPYPPIPTATPDNGASAPLNEFTLITHRTKRRLTAPKDVPLPPPPQDAARVKLNTKGKTDSEVLALVNAHIAMTEDNPDFPDPQPPTDVMLAAAAAFAAQMKAAALIKTKAQQITLAKNNARAVLESLFSQRGNYVQMASLGDEGKIYSAGMAVRADGSPVGILDMPLNLTIELNGIAGLMLLGWNPVKHARAYMVRWSDASTMEREWSYFKPVTESKQTLKDMPLGQRLAFSVCAIGGSSGQSAWSPEVVRMAA